MHNKEEFAKSILASYAAHFNCLGLADKVLRADQDALAWIVMHANISGHKDIERIAVALAKGEVPE